ncbi:MAG: DUF4397 domain-containing protein [Granulosicoccus sp.]|nr:DUF4397 domain-containing protein [Granulosicoccus sp.]
MSRWNSQGNCVRWLLLLAFLPALTGCDGGIFGTGDGSDSLSTVDASGPGDEIPAQTPDGTGNDGHPAAMPDAPEDNGATETRAFANLLITGSVSDPRLVMVNLSSENLTVRVGSDSANVFASPVVSGTTSQRVRVSVNASELTVLDENGSRRLLTLSPLHLGAFSVTTLIARDRPPTDAQGMAPSATSSPSPAVEIITLATRLSADAADVAGVRLLQADRLGTDDAPASMTLVPAGSEPGGAEVTLDDISVDSFGDRAAYEVVAPGSYVLTDSAARFDPIALTVAAAHTYTLIITGSPASLYIVNDSAPSGAGTAALR